MIRTETRRTAKMRADADQHQDFRLDRARFALDVIGLLIGLAFRVKQIVVDFLQACQHFRRALQHPGRLAAPGDNQTLAGLHLADVHFTRSAERSEEPTSELQSLMRISY